MSTLAEGIVENADTFTGVVRSRLMRIILMDYDDEPISNTKFKVMFQDGQTISVTSDEKGVIKFIRKAEGEFEIELLEEDEASAESSEGGV